jgi:outer membrane protein OmpA-like peptidoglycan-associated protein
MKYADQIAYVENAGPELNSQYAEFGAKNSPTTIDKIYYNSNRPGASIVSISNIDIYSTELDNGRWTAPRPLPPSVNTSVREEVSGFSSDGQVLYYLTACGGRLQILTDTFTDMEGKFFRGIFKGPFDPAREGADLYFFNDTIALFASDREGGYGGYDIYISVFSKGNWSTAANMGPAINSFYDERFPFLTRDGQTLFFSSDNLESVGGYDIFRSDFDPDKLAWSIPENLGFPINSALDDTHIVLAPDGMTAFISSNRKESHGDFDLYRVFFKQSIQEHQTISYVPTFYQVMQLAGADITSHEITDRPPEIKEYFLSHLFIEENGEVLAPQNVKKLDLLANLLLIYPKIKAELSSFEIPTGQKAFSLYFSIKKAEKAAEYLMRKGVTRDRILLKGYGSSFPLALNPGGMSNSPVYLKLNNRIEISLHDYEDEPVITHLENIPVPENLQDPLGRKFTTYRHQLYYSVQIASISQILQNQALESIGEVFIDVDNTQGRYRYLVGMNLSYTVAEELKNALINLGFTDAFIVPYFDGRRLSREEIPGYTAQYPDLLLYLAKTK